MRKIELLAPAGSFEALKAAIQSGADAIYLGGTLFSARAFAANFTIEEIKDAVIYAHLRNVKIYVTVNTLVYDHEIEDLIAYIGELYEIQVDALIIQDLGLMGLIHQTYPDLEIHVSTQASIHQLSGVNALAKQGATRVVLARENTLEEIKEICQNTDLEIEVFVHGALCMSYSGQCLMSSLIGKRSGNRGKCAQPCRLAYKLRKDHKILDPVPYYLLSAKDICVLENIQDFIDAGVTSFKIEGRMKRPEYVASVVKGYRKAIDAYIQDKMTLDLKQEKAEMFQIFNRGLSLGHAYHEKKMITDQFPGNFGIKIGKVTHYDKKNKLVSILLEAPLTQGDGIRFGFEDSGRVVNKMYLHERLVNKANKNDTVMIEFNQKIKENTSVYKTSSIELMQQISKEYQNHEIHLPITMTISGDIGKPMQLKVQYQQIEVLVESEVCIEKAISKSLEKDRIIQQLSKLGNTVYRLEGFDYQLPENIQFAIKALNELRRQGIEKLNEVRLSSSRKELHFQLPTVNHKTRTIQHIHVQVKNMAQFLAAIQAKVDTIYYPIEVPDFEKANALAYQEGIACIPYVDRMLPDTILKQFKEKTWYPHINKIFVGDLGCIEMFKDKALILDSSLNITNSYSLHHPLVCDHDCVLSVEMSKEQINAICDDQKHQLGIIVYGRLETMLTKYCPISQQHFHEQKIGCNLCKTGQYYLVDRKNETFPIMMDNHCRMHLYNSKIQWIDELDHLNVDFALLKMTFESPEEVDAIIRDFQNLIYHHQKSRIKTNYGITLGYFKNKSDI